MESLGDKLIIKRTNSSREFSDLLIVDHEYSEQAVIAGTNYEISLIGSDENRFYYAYAYKVFYVEETGVPGELIDFPETYYPFSGYLIGEKIFLIGNHSGIKIYVTDKQGSFMNLIYSEFNHLEIISESFEYNGKLGLVGTFQDRYDQSYYKAIIISDGTTENTYQLRRDQSNIFGVQAIGNQLYFMTLNYDTRAINLMKASGSLDSIVELFDFGDLLCFRNYNYLGQDVALYKGVYYFPFNDNAEDGSGHGCEVWAYDLLTHDLFMPLIER